MRRYVARRLGPSLADDIVSDTFLTAFRRRHRYDPSHPDARPWLYGIAARLIGRHRRVAIRSYRALVGSGVDKVAEPYARARRRPDRRAANRPGGGAGGAVVR
ncbi:MULTISPECIES: RNA polymerase sigma factor [unclassified Nonomuraea]|uniref:RNA polymerase sigma factor n=1 Tax=unclassified Nonomuraea TaxID=2593643 RepID=UPI0035C018A6